MAVEEVGGEEGRRPLPSGLCEPVTCEASIYSRVYLCPDVPVWLRKDDPDDHRRGLRAGPCPGLHSILLSFWVRWANQKLLLI